MKPLNWPVWFIFPPTRVAFWSFHVFPCSSSKLLLMALLWELWEFEYNQEQLPVINIFFVNFTMTENWKDWKHKLLYGGHTYFRNLKIITENIFYKYHFLLYFQVCTPICTELTDNDQGLSLIMVCIQFHPIFHPTQAKTSKDKKTFWIITDDFYWL